MAGPTYTIRLRSEDERDAIKQAAEDAGLVPSVWVRAVLLGAAGLPLDEPPEAEAGRRMRRGEANPWRRDDD